MSTIVEGMAEYPSSEWLVHGRDEVLDEWVRELRQLDPSRPIREVIAKLKTLEGRLLVVSEPFHSESDDDEDEKDEANDPKAASETASIHAQQTPSIAPASDLPSIVQPAPETSSIKSKKVTVPARASDLEELFVNNPKVCLNHLLFERISNDFM